MEEKNKKTGQEKWKEPCLLKPVLMVIVTVTLVGIWPLVELATQLITMYQVYVHEVANCLECKNLALK